MRKAFSFDDADPSAVAPGAGVPMLDWPNDLFRDEASATDLVNVDLHCQCEPFRFLHVPVVTASYAHMSA